MTLRISIDLAGLTYGDLYTFVEGARSAGKQRHDLVESSSEILGSGTEKLVVDLPQGLPPAARYVDGRSSGRYAAAIGEILSGDHGPETQEDLRELRALLLEGD